MRRLVRRNGLILLCAILACAPSRRATDAQRPRVVRSSELITAEEIASRQWTDVYEVIVTLRGNWLHDRGPDTINGQVGEVQVHFDELRLGGVGALRGMPVMNVTSIRYHRPNAAAARWGMGYDHGAIVVSTRQR